MNTTLLARSARQYVPLRVHRLSQMRSRCLTRPRLLPSTYRDINPILILQASSFHATRARSASSPTADALMSNLQELYATAKDEFEIAAEETTKKTVYAQDDRDAAREALTLLKEALEKAVKETDPDVAKEVTSRIGSRVRELENAVIAMEESAMED